MKICICQRVWIMIMCSIRAKPCFIHMCRLSVHPYWLSHVSQVSFCMLRVWYLRVLELFLCMYMLALKACVCMRLCLFTCLRAGLPVHSSIKKREVCVRAYACVRVCSNRLACALDYLEKCASVFVSVCCSIAKK